MRTRIMVYIGVWVLSAAVAGAQETVEPAVPFSGTQSCRRCHEQFYQLWAPSFHGLAMQPFTKALAETSLTPQDQPITVGDKQFQYKLVGEQGIVTETGPQGQVTYPVVHALGGKNVFYFLTPLEKGRLQTLPVSFDVHRQEWFDTASSAMRHIEGVDEEPYDWKDWPYTFNTACYSCHVSQLSSNYELKTDTYHTIWAEPGINCETCHGPASEHVKAFEAHKEGDPTPPLGLISTKPFNPEQMNSMCAPCHAKMSPMAGNFVPGDLYFDHYDLATLEDRDFYPDGRDLGENYTFTTWRMSPCVKSGQMDCIHCHTSSGRFRFHETPNASCGPCHAQRIDAIAAHSHHTPGPNVPTCIDCHMPMTEFARMRRSDHSMLPPAPAATVAFKSPNACNLCHTDKDAQWADKQVRDWHSDDYQAPVLHRGRLIEAARKPDWSKLPQMLAYVRDKEKDEIFRTSLIRLLGACMDPKKWPVIEEALNDESPMIRSSAAQALGTEPSQARAKLLLKATEDRFRLVRARAAASLAGYPSQWIKASNLSSYHRASKEYVDALRARPDSWSAHYNLGLHWTNLGSIDQAVQAYETSLTLEPRSLMPLINSSLLYSRLGDNTKSEAMLEKALVVDPNSAAAHFNLGLLVAEKRDYTKAKRHLQLAYEKDPTMAGAAYNLGVLLAAQNVKEAINWCQRAYKADSRDPKYAYTLAFYLHQDKQSSQAVTVLTQQVNRRVAHAGIYMLLGSIYQEQGNLQAAMGVFTKGAENPNLTAQEQQAFMGMALRMGY